jgi:ATP-binding cassette subfamily C protein LapB
MSAIPLSTAIPSAAGAALRDPLREALVLLCAHFGHSASVAELGQGFALERGRLPLALAPRALRRAGIHARVQPMALADITPALLPALLQLHDGRLLLWVERHGDQALLLDADSGGGQQQLTLAQLQALYAGQALFARPRYRPDARAQGYASDAPAHWLKGPLRACWPDYARVGLAALMSNLLAIASSLFALQVYDRVVPNSAFETLWLLASGAVLAISFEFVLRSLRSHMLEVVGKRLDLHLSSLLFNQVLQIRLQSKPASMGAFSNQVREFESVREFFTSTTAATISDLPFVLLFIAIVWLIGGPVAWVPLVAVLLILVMGLLTQGTLARLSRQNLREGAIKNGVLLEAIEHLETVKTTQGEGRLLQQWEGLTAEMASASVRSRSLTAAIGYGAALVQQLCYVGVVVVGVYQISQGQMTTGALVACSMLASRAISPMSLVAGMLARWQHVKVAMEGLDTLMAAPVERPAERRFARPAALTGHYRLENVRAGYGSQGPVALDIQQLEIRAGERVALLGGNGAGKSTLLRLLSGLTAPTEGQILLDNLAISQIDPAQLRQSIGYLPQDTALFFGTLRDNLSPLGAHLADDEMLAALEGVGLGEFVRAHPLGLDMQISGSASVSGGQRQAIGLARLLLLDPRIVLLDEPTAAFDQESELRVIRYLQTWLEGRTLILSTHKRQLLDLTQRAVVLRQGKVVMDGAQNQLVQGHRVQARQVQA